MTDPAIDDVTLICNALISERGGRARFSVSQLAAARKIAQLLSDDAGPGGAVASLIEMLPPPQQGPVPDWSKLSDKEFQLLDHLFQRALGEKVEKPKRERQSQRQFNADQLARRIDAIAVERREPTPIEMNEIAGDVGDLLYPCIMIPAYLWPETCREVARGLAAASPPSPPVTV